LPQPLPSVESPWAYFNSNYAIVEYGGGFYHYGYKLRLDETASSSRYNIWELYLDREGQNEKLLHRFPLAANARVGVSQFTSNALAEYDRLLASSPDDIELHKARIAFLLRYRPEQAQAACMDAIKAFPQHWWPRLTLALLETRKGDSPEAAREFVKYVEAKPSYSRYIYLSYFFQVTGKSEEAAAAIEKAILCPIVDLDDDDSNTESRGYSIAVYAYQSRHYSTVVRLCDALLPIHENGDYAKTALRDLKSAAESAQAGATVDFKPSESMSLFNPYERTDAAALFSTPTAWAGTALGTNRN
jgi:tetratricopeptide (TPR) repeat protein